MYAKMCFSVKKTGSQCSFSFVVPFLQLDHHHKLKGLANRIPLHETIIRKNQSAKVDKNQVEKEHDA